MIDYHRDQKAVHPKSDLKIFQLIL